MCGNNEEMEKSLINFTEMINCDESDGDIVGINNDVDQINIVNDPLAVLEVKVEPIQGHVEDVNIIGNEPEYVIGGTAMKTITTTTLTTLPSVDVVPVDCENENSVIKRTSVKCEPCNKYFKNIRNYKNHLKSTHIDVKLFKCDICDKSFAQSIYLKAHKRIHSGEKPFICDTCGKAFNQSSNLQTHIKTHTGEKPFQCNVCNKAFNRSDHYQKHFRTHSGEKPYHCEICGKAFSRLDNYQIHARTHTGEKPYICQTCGKSFAQSSSLRIHLRTHTGEKPFHCELCFKYFSQSNSYERHMKRHAVGTPIARRGYNKPHKTKKVVLKIIGKSSRNSFVKMNRLIF